MSYSHLAPSWAAFTVDCIKKLAFWRMIDFTGAWENDLTKNGMLEIRR
jgi:hypothetical protein